MQVFQFISGIYANMQNLRIHKSWSCVQVFIDVVLKACLKVLLYNKPLVTLLISSVVCVIIGYYYLSLVTPFVN